MGSWSIQQQKTAGATVDRPRPAAVIKLKVICAQLDVKGYRVHQNTHLLNNKEKVWKNKPKSAAWTPRRPVKHTFLPPKPSGRLLSSDRRPPWRRANKGLDVASEGKTISAVFARKPWGLPNPPGTLKKKRHGAIAFASLKKKNHGIYTGSLCFQASGSSFFQKTKRKMSLWARNVKMSRYLDTKTIWNRTWKQSSQLKWTYITTAHYHLD